MGGLVSRALLETNKSNGAAWKNNLHGLITLATPHLGAGDALAAITGKFGGWLIWLIGALTVEKFVDDSRYPSTYELLPPPQVTCVTDPQGKPLSIYSGGSGSINQYLIDTFQPSPPNDDMAANFSEAIGFFKTLTYQPVPGVHYYCLYGEDNPTTENFVYDSSIKYPKKRLYKNQSVSGDGVVPATSGQFASVAYQNYSFRGTESSPITHMQMAQRQDVLDQVITIIQPFAQE
jgi:hypothetical protein